MSDVVRVEGVDVGGFLLDHRTGASQEGETGERVDGRIGSSFKEKPRKGKRDRCATVGVDPEPKGHLPTHKGFSFSKFGLTIRR